MEGNPLGRSVHSIKHPTRKVEPKRSPFCFSLNTGQVISDTLLRWVGGAIGDAVDTWELSVELGQVL